MDNLTMPAWQATIHDREQDLPVEDLSSAASILREAYGKTYITLDRDLVEPIDNANGIWLIAVPIDLNILLLRSITDGNGFEFRFSYGEYDLTIEA